MRNRNRKVYKCANIFHMVTTTKYINHVRYNQELNLDYIIENGGSIYQFLSFLDFDDIILEIEGSYQRTPQYNVRGILMLAIAYHFENIGYENTIRKVSDLDKDILNFKHNKMPSSSKLCDFVTKQITKKQLKELMFKIGFKLYQIQSILVLLKIAHFDSAPNESSRYDKYAKYNSHYKCKMYKSHILMFGTIPLYMKFTNGTTNDKKIMNDFFNEIKHLGFKFHEMNLDAGYDSYEINAKIWKTFGAKPNIAIRENAVINKKGTIQTINNKINKAWKEGMNINKSIEEKLEYLFNKNEIEMVGSFFRNKTIKNGLGFSYPFRNYQERTHNSIKKTVKFDTRFLHNKNKKLHILWSFISYQLLCLTALQNNIKSSTFGFIY